MVFTTIYQNSLIFRVLTIALIFVVLSATSLPLGYGAISVPRVSAQDIGGGDMGGGDMGGGENLLYVFGATRLGVLCVLAAVARGRLRARRGHGGAELPPRPQPPVRVELGAQQPRQPHAGPHGGARNQT